MFAVGTARIPQNVLVDHRHLKEILVIDVVCLMRSVAVPGQFDSLPGTTLAFGNSLVSREE